MQPMQAPSCAGRLKHHSVSSGPAGPHVCGAVSSALINGRNYRPLRSAPAAMLRAALGGSWTTQTSPKAVREDDGLPAGTTPAQACLHQASYLSCRP